MKINKNGYWENPNDIGHHNDIVLLNNIIKFISENDIKNVVDFGCGNGYYISEIGKSENVYCEAYDGNPNTEFITNGVGKILDVSKEFDLDKKFDLVISLEVGEHIPKEYEEIFIKNLIRHSNKYLIISWAIVGQSGDGHINCQNNDYIINSIKSKGFNYLENKTLEFRNSGLNLWWFVNTIMIFEKIKKNSDEE